MDERVIIPGGIQKRICSFKRRMGGGCGRSQEHNLKIIPGYEFGGNSESVNDEAKTIRERF